MVLPHPVHGPLGWICVVNPASGRPGRSCDCCVRPTRPPARVRRGGAREPWRVSGGPQPDSGGFVDTDRRCMMADRRPSRVPPLSRRYGVPSCPARRPSSAAPARASPKVW
ncbi:hypothetical protein ACFZCU_35150 [Streptomyces canus]|uniref:hypothetical protein n=1 Tax=Streptomyces canus TaxID=58343 RepID=UPI0036E81DA0